MTRNEIKEKYPDKQFGINLITVTRKTERVEECREISKPYPEFGYYHTCAHGDDYGAHAHLDKGWSIELPHSCDEWVIGTVEEAQRFNTDLAEAIAYAKNNP